MPFNNTTARDSSGIPKSTGTPAPSSPDTIPLFPTSQMSQPLTGQPWNRSTSSPEDTRVSRSPTPANEPGPTMSATCGRMSLQPFAYYDPESQCLRMSQGTLASEWGEYSQTLPRHGSMRNGQLYERQTPQLLTTVPESSSLLPTPIASDSNGVGEHGHGGADLRTTIALLPTPKASDGPNGGPGMRNGRGEADALPGVVALLPTPVADNRRLGPYQAACDRWAAVLGRPAPPPTVTGDDDRQRLSPLFVEWMMGLPAGHVTGHGVPRTQQLKMLGNGVVPQQATMALDVLT